MQIDLNNRKLLKEWKKIKDFDIFQDINEFALLFFEKPYGICMRKYTSYPWCKENFFFGSYDELKEWYQTTEEIPFYVKEVVGQKFGRLTVLDFLYKHNSKGIRTLHATCKCECGNTTDVDYRNLKHGDILSCGCRMRNKEPQTIKQLSEEILRYWDYDKNIGIDPYQISSTSMQKYWWKDKAGNSYQLEPYVFATEDTTNSSFPEQALFYYTKKEYSSAINRANFITSDGEILEIDIYIPAYNIGIEYDGLFWHKDKADADTYKSNILCENGVKLIRIRENGLPKLKTNDFIIEQPPYYEQKGKDLIASINQVLNFINKTTNNAGRENITIEDFNIDKNSIYALMCSKPVDRNITNTCIMRFWDKEKNGELKPECVSINSPIKIHYLCSANHSISVSPKRFKEQFAKGTSYYRIPCDSRAAYNLCDSPLCCPFANLNFCIGEDRAKCLYRNRGEDLRKNGYSLPILYCNTKDISIGIKAITKKNSSIEFYDFERRKWVKTIRKSLLEFSFMNKSAFPFSITRGFNAALFSDSTIIREYSNDYFEGKWYEEIINPLEYRKFKFFITRDLFPRLPNNTLVIYNRLFKEEYMRGWRYVIFLIIEFDNKGIIKNQYSKIYSDTDLENKDEFLKSKTKELGDCSGYENESDILISKLINHI